MKKFIKEVYPYVIIIISVILFRTFIATPVMVSGSSMYDTLEGNEVLILNKLAKIDRYDIVVIDYEEDEDHLIKRVIGLPKETVKIENSYIYINGKKIADKYANGKTEDNMEITLKSDEYFVLGDNRIVSKDSRYIGPIKAKNIEGTAKVVIWPLNKIGIVK